MTPDIELLTQYARERDEAAFAELVRRHLDHVHSTALRLVAGDSHLAEDVAQAVFGDLARKARSLGHLQTLSGWLHQSARFAAAKLVRSEQRRRHREQASIAMPSHTPDPDWSELRPIIDHAIAELPESERGALLLRFFEKKPFTEVGAVLGISENAARMRIDRALEKLRARLAARGLASSAAILGSALAQNVVQTAPAALGTKISARAVTLGTAGSTGILSWFASLSTGGRIAVGSALLVGLTFVGIVLHQNANSNRAKPALSTDQASLAPSSSLMRTAVAKNSRKATQPDSNLLELLFVDAQTGQPVTNTTARLSGWEKGAQTLVKKEVTLEQGRCRAPFKKELGFFWVITRLEGYADTRLQWTPRLGDVIPDSYTLRLVRPVFLSGRVVDPAGKPVAGSEIGFGPGAAPNDASHEDHHIFESPELADANGHWAMKYLAADVLPRLYAAASHSNYSRASVHVGSEPAAAQQMLDGTFVFRLGETMTVRGRVVDPDGLPVADAVVRVGRLDTVDTREGRSAMDGSFAVAGCSLKREPVTAEAVGYAPAVLTLDIRSQQEPILLRLENGKSLHLQIVNEQGESISGARAGYHPFGNERRGIPPQVEFTATSDANGVIIWENAPDDELEFGFYATGYGEKRGVVVRRESEEERIVLKREFVIAGTVRDADSGELLPRFRLRVGYPAQPGGQIEPRWIDIDRFAPLFTGGKFRHSLTEGGDLGAGKYIFQFEAEGHKPQVSRVYQVDAGEVQVDIRLDRADETTVGVYTPQGALATQAHVGLFDKTNRLRVGPAGFASEQSASVPPWLRQTDDKGCFGLPKDDAIHQIAVAHPQGYIEVAADELRKTRGVRLQPWARVEGIVRQGGAPVVNVPVSIQRKFPETGDPRLLSLEFYNARTDEEGRFTFPCVPPATFELSVSKESPGLVTSRRVLEFETQPGVTNQLQVDTGLTASRE